MAEFGIKATQISAPQGAGSSPLSPVSAFSKPAPRENPYDNAVEQAQRIDTTRDNSALFKIAENALDIFAKGAKDKAKEEAEKLKNSVVGNYLKRQEAINQGIRSGDISPSRGKGLAMSLFGEYGASYPEYIGDLDKAAGAMRGNTEMGDVEDIAKTEKARFDSAVNAAQSAGHPVPPWADDKTKKSAVEAHQASIRAESELQAFYRKANEDRAAGSYDQGIADRQAKELASENVQRIASTNYTSTFDFLNTLQQGVSGKQLTSDEAQMAWEQRTGMIMGAISEAAKTNPEMANAYRSTFNDLKALGAKMLDPNKNAEDVEREVKQTISRAKLAILQKDPKLAKIVGVSELFKNNSDMALKFSSDVADALGKMLDTPVDTPAGGSPAVVPQVIGNPVVEKAAFEFVEKSLKDYHIGSLPKDEKTNTELKNSVDNILQQIGDAMGKRGVDAKYLARSAAFVASPEFGKYSLENKIDQQALQGAVAAYQVLFQKDVVGAVERSIQSTVENVSFKPVKGQLPAGIRETTSFKPANLKLEFTGAGVVFKTGDANNLAQAQVDRGVLSSLSEPQKAINQLIHMGAHLEGTTDYARFWEENKHKYVPSMFTAPPKKEGEQSKGGSYKTEKQALANMADTPAEQASASRREAPGVKANRLQQDIVEIKREIERATSPEIKRILEAELKRIGG